MPEVEVAMTTSSPTAAEIPAKSSRLTSRRSGPFSCTKSTPASAFAEVAVEAQPSNRGGLRETATTESFPEALYHAAELALGPGRRIGCRDVVAARQIIGCPAGTDDAGADYADRRVCFTRHCVSPVVRVQSCGVARFQIRLAVWSRPSTVIGWSGPRCSRSLSISKRRTCRCPFQFGKKLTSISCSSRPFFSSK
jgi:hypothetical protein